MENPILSSLPSMSRSSSAVSQGDVHSFLQCLRFDPKFGRQVDFKRLTSVAFGIPVDDSLSASSKVKPTSSPNSLDELKRLKAGLRESSIKARERLKIFNEALSLVNKCFPSIPLRKRSRSDAAISCGFEEPPKSEERTKIAIPNKRTRTSMVDTDVRANTPARPSGNMDRDREVLRLPHSGAAQVEERSLTTSGDGWEKTKMKKKRSGIKPDVSPSTVAPKPIDGYREPRQGMQPRLLADARSRLTDSDGFRPGVANGAMGVGKADAVSQPTSLGMRSSMPKPDLDNAPFSMIEEIVPLLPQTKKGTNSRDDFSAATKMNSAARAPRSGSNGLHKLSPVVQRTTVANDWELSHCTSKSTS
ncbi:hypothetical protein RHGRI_012976 [Rhododendron griersonianum]|uniref:Uncharacterized protein n=1 Tax=Rhododendron griersonianum TaxID=479676 RepID=A0AAV6K3V2_9ERIC|nr:hypothetical protein RHGRI_012976 [Rhododendron griersonianum]